MANLKTIDAQQLWAIISIIVILLLRVLVGRETKILSDNKQISIGFRHSTKNK